MTNTVVQFPSKSVREWTTIERSMVEALEECGVSEQAKKLIVANMKEFWETLKHPFDYTIQIALPGKISPEEADVIRQDIATKVGSAHSERLQAFTNKLFIERVKREARFYNELGIL